MNITVMGCGKLGACWAALLAEAGHNVFCVDRNEAILDAIRARLAPVEEPGLQDLFDRAGERLTGVPFDRAAEVLATSEFVFIVVPTPSKPDGSFSNDYVLETLRPIGQAIQDDARLHVVLTSTVSPRSCDEVLIPELDRLTGRCAGLDYGFSYNPEFIALGTVIRDMRRPDFILIGSRHPSGADELAGLYTELHMRIGNPIPQLAEMNLLNAEITKLSVNCYLTTKISFANQIGTLCENLDGADAQVVLDAVGLDSRIGHKYLRAGTPFCGPCLPRDTYAMRCADKDGALLCQAAEMINREQVEKFLGIIMQQKPERIAILGLSYKPGTAVTEDSVAARLIPLLADLTKCPLQTHDPLAQILDGHVVHHESLPTAVRDADVVLIATDHPEYHELKAEWFKQSAVILDLWNILDGLDDFRHFRRWVPGRGCA